MRNYPHPALVLWLIREGTAKTWFALCDYFDAIRGSNPSYLIYDSVATLYDANLIEADKDIVALEQELRFRRGHGRNVSFSLTASAHEILRALDIRLTELAKADPRNRLIVSPILRRNTETQHESDILVFMPFVEVLRPVYDDHLKSVASKLGQSIKRADDFFTTQEVMADVWSALIDTKLVIADCTGRNPNVFYELGLAHAIGKPAIVITQNGEDIPFDLRHRRYISYELTPRGMKRFEEELEQTIGRELTRSF